MCINGIDGLYFTGERLTQLLNFSYIMTCHWISLFLLLQTYMERNYNWSNSNFLSVNFSVTILLYPQNELSIINGLLSMIRSLQIKCPPLSDFILFPSTLILPTIFQQFKHNLPFIKQNNLHHLCKPSMIILLRNPFFSELVLRL